MPPNSRELTRDDLSAHEAWFASVAASGGLLVTWGLMPAAAFGISTSLAASLREMATLELAGVWVPSGRSPTDAGSADFQAGYGVLRVCPALLRTRFLLDACSGLFAGAVRAEGTGFDLASFQRRSWLWGASADARVTLPLPLDSFLRLASSLAVPFARDTFVVETTSGETARLHRLSSVVATAQLEAGVRF